MTAPLPAQEPETERDTPSFFNGVALDKAVIYEHAEYIRTYADLISSAVKESDKSVSALKATVEASMNAAVEMQRRIDRLRGGLSLLDRKIAVHQARRPRA